MHINQPENTRNWRKSIWSNWKSTGTNWNDVKSLSVDFMLFFSCHFWCFGSIVGHFQSLPFLNTKKPLNQKLNKLINEKFEKNQFRYQKANFKMVLIIQRFQFNHSLYINSYDFSAEHANCGWYLAYFNVDPKWRLYISYLRWRIKLNSIQHDGSKPATLL